MSAVATNCGQVVSWRT